MCSSPEMSTPPQIDYTMWDWLPLAADELENYLMRILGESGITAHAVTVRTKSITSFTEKSGREGKSYTDPQHEITDIIAARIITYSTPDKDDVVGLLRKYFAVKAGEDKNPGAEREEHERGYDCHHLIVTSAEDETGWLPTKGNLAKYFAQCSGLELQVRTVAAHAWAEFEHEHRYKGKSYEALEEQSPETIRALDGLFAAASDARRALDEIFAQIKRLLDHPVVRDGNSTGSPDPLAALTPTDGPEERASREEQLDADRLKEYLASRYPDDSAPSDDGIDFALDVLSHIGIKTSTQLSTVLGQINSDAVRDLMSFDRPVTSVRRLDDDLLALFGDTHIEKTGNCGTYSVREQQLRFRFNRLRGKLATSPTTAPPSAAETGQ